MKHVLNTILLLMAFFLPFTAAPHEFEVDGIYYNTNGDEATVTYRGSSPSEYSDEYSGNIIIPSSVSYCGKTYSVTSIDLAFYHCSWLTSITIPNSVALIGEGSFSNCTSLKNVTIPNSVTNIGRLAFYKCTSLKSINIPGSVSSIDLSAFGECTGLTEATIYAKSIGTFAFYGCTGLTDVILHSKSIEGGAFQYCDNLLNVTLASTVKSIGPLGFDECPNLKSITSYAVVPPRIESSTFYNYDALLFVPSQSLNSYKDSDYWNNFIIFPTDSEVYFFTIDGITYLITDSIENRVIVMSGDNDFMINQGVVNIPSQVVNDGITYQVTAIAARAFINCTNLTSIILPAGITSIGNYAFEGCINLTNITIPNSVTSIGNNAFSGCSDLTSAYIPTSVKTIGSEAFSDCSGLTSITIPNSVTSIGDNVFSGCSSLTELYFNAVSCADFTESPFTNTFIANIQVGDDCQKIPANFTKDLTSLRAITLGNSVTTIGNSAFLGCTSMTNVSMGSALTTINNSAFEGCTGLKEISLPMSLRTIRSKAFYNCSGLQSVYSYADNPPVMESSDIFNCYNTATLYVPYEVLNTYKNTYYWNNFYKILGVDANGNVLIAGISLNSTSEQIYVNQTFKLTATITPSEATNKTVNWTSSNPSVAIVDNDGLVTALSDGTAVITATTTDGTDLSASCYVTVMSIPVTSILLNKTSLTLDINDVNTYQLTATVSPSNATNKTVTWSSSNTAVASVSSDGLVTLIAPGNATITATTTDGTDLSASCQVTVVKRVKSITLSESSMTIYLPETAQLIATITPSDAVNPVLNWTSSNTSVATVNSEGFITSIGVGTTTIKATTTDGSNLSATCQVSVNKRYVTSITLNETSLVMHIGDTFQLAADIQPENASDQTLNWSTGNSSVASVDNNGLVTAIAGGTTYIQAKTRDGSSLTARCTIEVKPDYYITLDTLFHIRGEATRIVDLPVSLVNKNPISGIQFDVSLPNGVEFNLVDSVPDVWLDDARGTRSHSISASQLSNGKYRVLVTSATSRDLRGNDGVLVHMNMLLPQQHDTGNRYINITNIIASEADETRHTLDNKSTVVHFYYIVGDADANAVVDIADHAATASKILGRSPSPFYYDAANVDDNYSLDVADLVGITNIALEIKPITVRQAPRRGETENQLFCDRLNLNAGGEKEINLGIDCGFAFAGFQMDVELPNGLTLTGATLGDDASALGLATEMMPDGKIRILGTSFSDSEVDGNCPRLLTLKVKAERNYMPGSEIKFADILFAERDMTAHAFDGLCIEYIEPSTVYELTDDTRIYVENGNIIVDTPVAGIVQLIAIDGRMIEYQAHVGHNVFAVDASGIYIINFNGKTLKVRL